MTPHQTSWEAEKKYLWPNFPFYQSHIQPKGVIFKVNLKLQQQKSSLLSFAL